MTHLITIALSQYLSLHFDKYFFNTYKLPSTVLGSMEYTEEDTDPI